LDDFEVYFHISHMFCFFPWDRLIDTIDVVVVGAYFGEGRHGKIFSSYLLAAPLRASPAHPASADGGAAADMHVDSDRPTWRIVGKVGGGLTDVQRTTLNDFFALNWMRVDKRTVCDPRIKTPEDLAAVLEPDQQFFSKLVAYNEGHFPWPPRFIDPEKSLVLEVTVSEIHAAKVSLLRAVCVLGRGGGCVAGWSWPSI
jgi:ATP-dependent DNA ligase